MKYWYRTHQEQRGTFRDKPLPMNDTAPTINRSLVLFGLMLASSEQLRAQQPQRNQTDA